MIYPYEELIAPCCEDCDEENCPGDENCFVFLYSLRRERFYTQEESKKIYESD